MNKGYIKSFSQIVRVSLVICILFFSFDLNGQDLFSANMKGFAEFKPQGSKVSKSHPKVRRASLSSKDGSIGAILLSDDRILEGIIKYNIAEDVVQVESMDSVRIFAANQIRLFEILNDLPRVSLEKIGVKRDKRVFYSIPYAGKSGYSRPKIFEMVVEGNTSLLRRWVYGSRYSDRKLYLKNPEGKITRIKKRRGQVIHSFDGKHNELRQVAKRERLNMYDMRDVIRLVETYNRISNQ